jgi:DNA topoisomerase-1
VTLIAEAKSGGVRRGSQLLREVGEHPEGGSVGLYRGRYGPYVGHERLIASLPKGADPDRFTLAEALPLLAAQKAKGEGKTARTARPARAGASTNGARASTPKSRQKKRPGVKRRHA